MVAAATPALSATADGNQKKPGFPGFIPPGANPQQVAAAQAPVMVTDGMGPRPAPQPEPASAGVDGIPTGGPTGWTGGATQPAPKTAFGDLQSTIQNQVEKAVWGSTITPSPSTGLPSPQKPSTAPVAQPYRNEGQNYTAGGKVQSPAVTTAPAGVPQRNAAGALTSLGAGTDVVGGIKKYVVDGKTLYSNMGDSGDGGNLSLMNRGAPTAQSMAAMDNLVARSEKQISDGVKMLQHQDQVAAATAFREAQARQEQSRSFAERLNNPRSEESVAINNLQRQLKPNLGESPAAFAARTAAVQAQINAITGAESLSSAERQATNQLGFKRDELTAKQQLEQSNLGLKRQQVGNELATGAQSRDAKGMEIAAAKQLQTLQAQLLDPNITNAKRTEVAKLIAGLSGKTGESSLKDNFLVVGGGQEFDQKSNQLINKPQSLIDLRTGLAVSGPPSGGSPSASFVEGGIYPLTGGGSAVFKDGKLKRVE